MKKLFILIFLLASISLQAQNVPDLIRTTPVPATGANKNNRATVDANLKAGLSFLAPTSDTYTLNGAKDSAGYLQYNKILKRLGVYRGAGIWDNPLNVVTTSYQNLNINEKMQVITDATANFSKSLYLPQGSTDPGVRPIYGPYLGLENGEYTYKFYLKINTNLTDTARFLHVDIAENGNSIMSTYIRYSDFIGANVWTPFRIVFNGVKGRNYECRIDVVHGSDPYPAQYPTKTNLWYDYGQIIGIREFVPADLGDYATQTDLANGLNSLTSTNGLTKTGSNTQLGGNLIHPTYLNAFTYVFGLHGANSRYSYDFSSAASEGEEGPDKSSIILGANDNQTNTASSLNIRSDGFALKYSITGNTNFVISSDGTITDNIRSKGWSYTDNYFTTGPFEDRRIPDLGMVKSLFPAGGVADDALVLHKFGAETARGDKTLKDMLTIQKNILFQDTVSNNAWYLDIENPASGGNGLTISKTGQPYFQFLDHGVLIRSSNGYVRDTVLFKSDIVGKFDSVTTAKRTYQPYVTTAYDRAIFTNLNDFTVNGSVSPTINAATNGIVMSGGANDFNNYITINGLTNNSRSQDYIVSYVATDLTGFGIRIGRYSIHPTGKLSGFCGYDIQNNTFYVGNVAATPSGITVAAGDYLRVTISMRQDVLLSATFEDVTKGFKFTLTDPSTQVNTGDVVIYNAGGNTEIKQIRVLEYTNPNANIYTLSDSKFLLPARLNIPFYLNRLGTVGVFGGQSDNTIQLLAAAPYMVKYMKPSTIYLNFLRNDLLLSNPLSQTSKDNYVAIVNIFKAAKWKVVHVLPIPENTIPDQSSINTFINGEASFATDGKVDPSVGFSNANYVSADNIHLNEAGNRFVASTIVASNTSPLLNNYQADNYNDSKGFNALTNQRNNFSAAQSIQSLLIGNSSTALNTAQAGIFFSNSGGTYPYTFNGHLVLNARGNSVADHVFMNNGVVKGYAKGSTGEFNWAYTDGATHVVNASIFNVNGGIAATDLSLSSTGASLPLFTNSLKKVVTNPITGTGSVVMSTAPTVTAPILTTVKPASTFQTPIGTAGTDSLAVKIAATGKIGAISPAYYATATALSGYVPTTRTITTTLPLTGGGDLSANRTFGIGGLTAYGTANQVLGMNAAATGYEYKTYSVANGVTITDASGSKTWGLGNITPTTVSTGLITSSTLTASQLVATDASKNLVSTTTIPNGTAATTQSAGDNSTKVATTGYTDAAVLASGRTRAFLNSNLTLTLNGDFLATTSTLFSGALPPTTGFLTDGSKLIVVAATGTGGARVTVPAGYTLVGLSGAATPSTGGITIVNGGKVQLAPVGTNSYQYYVLSGGVTVN